MRILIVASTDNEINPLIPFIKENRNIDFLITGIGMVATAYDLAKKLNKTKYDFALNTGIAGSFNRDIRIGEVVNVISDRFSEMGAEDDKKFIPLFKMGIKTIENTEVLINKTVSNNKTINKLKKVKGITVNTVHGNETSIKKISDTFKPDIETMEGAAFMYVCTKENLQYAQIRSVSNYVERRNKLNWNIPLALNNLNKTLIEIINELMNQ